jgi:hypothetical protein
VGWSSVGASIDHREADGSGIPTDGPNTVINTEIEMSNMTWTSAQVRIWRELITTTASEGVGSVWAILDNWILTVHEELTDHLKGNPDQRNLVRDVQLNARYLRPASKRKLHKITRQPVPVECPPSEAADQPSCGAVQDPQGATSDVAPRGRDAMTVIVSVEVSAGGERGRSRRIRYEIQV